MGEREPCQPHKGYQFDYVGDPESVIIDPPQSDIWDASTVATLDASENKYAAKGKKVTIIGLNDERSTRHQRLAGHLSGNDPCGTPQPHH